MSSVSGRNSERRCQRVSWGRPTLLTFATPNDFDCVSPRRYDDNTSTEVLAETHLNILPAANRLVEFKICGHSSYDSVHVDRQLHVSFVYVNHRETMGLPVFQCVFNRRRLPIETRYDGVDIPSLEYRSWRIADYLSCCPFPCTSHHR